MTAWLPRCVALLLSLVLPFVFVAAAAPPAGPSGSEVARLIERLGDDDFDKREDASERLATLGDRAILPLYRATFSGDPEVRWRASRLHRRLSAQLVVFRGGGD